MLNGDSSPHLLAIKGVMLLFLSVSYREGWITLANRYERSLAHACTHTHTTLNLKRPLWTLRPGSRQVCVCVCAHVCFYHKSNLTSSSSPALSASGSIMPPSPGRTHAKHRLGGNKMVLSSATSFYHTPTHTDLISLSLFVLFSQRNIFLPSGPAFLS